MSQAETHETPTTSRRMTPSSLDPMISRTPARRVLARALLRRCPGCGSTGIFRNWFNQVEVCPACGLRLDRGEKDFFIGAYTLNLIVAELIVFFGGIAVLVLTWPEVPWTTLTWGLVLLMVAGPVILYPWSRQFWLALDLILRPAEPQDYTSGQ